MQVVAVVDSATDLGFCFVVVVPVAVVVAVVTLEAQLYVGGWAVVGFVIQPGIRLAVDVAVPVPVRVLGFVDPADSIVADVAVPAPIVAMAMGLSAVVVPVVAAAAPVLAPVRPHPPPDAVALAIPYLLYSMPHAVCSTPLLPSFHVPSALLASVSAASLDNPQVFVFHCVRDLCHVMIVAAAPSVPLLYAALPVPVG
jgi:hypothetical protein